MTIKKLDDRPFIDPFTRGRLLRAYGASGLMHTK